MASESGQPWYRLRVPASSANIGPGFDALGMAVSLYLHCRLRRSESFKIRVSGRNSTDIPATEDNLIWRTAQRVAEGLGTLPPIELEVDNGIPLGKGLGSSAAALTAGVVIADLLLGLNWKPHRILDEAARLEGHPDNVAACVLGSIVASAIDTSGVARAVRLELPAHFAISIVVPDFDLPTAHARLVLPEAYSRADAIFNVQRAALLIGALANGDRTAFPTALEDRLHQPYRAHLVPGLEQILQLRAPGLLGCALSGAGPAVLVFFEKGYGEVCDLVQQVFQLNGHSSEVLRAELDHEGYRLEREG